MLSARDCLSLKLLLIMLLPFLHSSLFLLKTVLRKVIKRNRDLTREFVQALEKQNDQLTLFLIDHVIKRTKTSSTG